MSSKNEVLLSLPKTIFLIYLIISGNFLAGLFGCNTQAAFSNNMALKHLLGFMTMFFFIVVVDSDSKWSDNPKTQLLYTLLFYSIFVITTRMDYKWWIAFVLCLSLMYILQVYKDHKDTTDEEKEKYETYQLYLIYLSAIIVFLGFFIYLGRKKAEYKNSFDFVTFMVGKPVCKFDGEPTKMNDLQAIGKIFG